VFISHHCRQVSVIRILPLTALCKNKPSKYLPGKTYKKSAENNHLCGHKKSTITFYRASFAYSCSISEPFMITLIMIPKWREINKYTSFHAGIRVIFDLQKANHTFCRYSVIF